MARFDWHDKSIFPCDLATIVRHRANEDPIFRSISASPDLTMELVASRPAAKWDFEALSNHKNISLHDKLRHHTLPWEMMNKADDPLPPLSLVLSLPDLPWEYDELWCKWPLDTILDVSPDSDIIDWHEVSTKAAGNISLVAQYASLGCQVRDWLTLCAARLELGLDHYQPECVPGRHSPAQAGGATHGACSPLTRSAAVGIHRGSFASRSRSVGPLRNGADFCIFR
jgi:hypothetical protein